MRLRTCSSLAAALLLACSLPLALVAADKDDDLKRKEAEIQQLKRQLEQAQKEIKVLKKELKVQPVGGAAPVASAVPDKPLTPLATLPPLKPDETVDAAELARYFKEDPAGASQRFEGQNLRLKGTIARFDSTLFVRSYTVILDATDRLTYVTCQFNYPDGLLAVFPAEGGTRLVGRVSEKVHKTMLELGDAVVIRGRCTATKNGRVTLKGCTVLERKQVR